MDVVQIETPVGWFRCRSDAGTVLDARFVDDGRASADDAHIAGVLAAYFAGDVTAIDHVAVVTTGSAFQRSVWAALRRIPAGATASYVEIAREIGSPGASRAVGAANASNPIGVIVPCHRVVRADGSIGGYGGGVARKQWLLTHERRGSGDLQFDGAGFDVERRVLGVR
jgi:methylated-DNA-[protein]-cysteine S-methyltransferase